ncbi:MAG: 23S rRNA (pseudouridine(1915)-N(3))-methyltransferase RlmH [Ruminococcaceae bacterium]|nr:23S rRNA (pseudouridine(1915)-N(3))-methyltransferase RlmH [Oscillospiraceae bacterium]
MLEITVVCVGNLKEKYFTDACNEYAKRLSAFCRLKVVELKDGTPIIPYLPARARKIALCVEGKQLSSEELADYIEKLPNMGVSELCFVIGAFDGLPEEVKACCDMRLSFSKMTFPHRLMRVILLEQIYRAFTIISGGKYHK